MTSYRVIIKDPVGQNPKVLTNIISLEAARAVNTVGSATLILPNEFRPSYWQRDMRVEIWRNLDNGFSHLLGDTYWFARRFVWQYTEDRWLVELKDTNDLLARRIVAYTAETDFAEKIEDWGTDDPADNEMRSYVRQNLGDEVENSFRDLSAYIEVEVDRNLAPVTQKEASFQPLFQVLTELANDSAELGERLFFSLDPQSNGKFLFRVAKGALGQDRTTSNRPVLFGPGYRNMTEIEIEWDYRDEATVVYAGGDGEGAGRLWTAVKDDSRVRRSPFGRIEVFIDSKDQDDENLLMAEARAELAKRRPKLRLTGQAVDTPLTQFGRDYDYGDVVQAVVGELRFNCLVDAFSVSYDDGKESGLDIRLNGEMSL